MGGRAIPGEIGYGLGRTSAGVDETGVVLECRELRDISRASAWDAWASVSSVASCADEGLMGDTIDVEPLPLRAPRFLRLVLVLARLCASS